MRKWHKLFALALVAFGCTEISVPVDHSNDLGDIKVGDIFIPYEAVEQAADFLGRPVAQIWHLMYEGYLVNGPPVPPAQTSDLRVAARLLERAGIEIPVDLDGGLVAADDGHMCTLMNFSGDWDDDDEVDEWLEHHLYPWGVCMDALTEIEGCAEEDLETSRSEDDEGRTYLHVWCEPDPD